MKYKHKEGCLTKLSNKLYKATRKLGKTASTVNTIEKLGKTIETGDVSHIANRLVKKETNKAIYKTANKASSTINNIFK